MSKRHFSDWLAAFVEHASIGEAPRRMYFWVGVSAVAGALRRKVWLDFGHYTWYPNFFTILVAPPGIVSKSTTASIATRLLKEVPGVKFGPDVVTWPALVSAFAESLETFQWNGAHIPMSALNIASSEFGNFLNPQDRDMVDLLVSLYDCAPGAFEKVTKHSGSDTVENPWLNIIACTTPAWIAGNFPEYMIGGGFTSRCTFVYADKKERYVAYPDEALPPQFFETRAKLIQDLEAISLDLTGPYELSKDARAWGKIWYQEHFERPRPQGMDDERFGGYVARKQTHVHKLAMVLCASQGGSMRIELEDLQTAVAMVTDLEKDMPKVFAKIGQTSVSQVADRLISHIRARGKVKYMDAFRYVHAQLPSMREFEDLLMGMIKAGFVTMNQIGGDIWLLSTFEVPLISNAQKASPDGGEQSRQAP